MSRRVVARVHDDRPPSRRRDDPVTPPRCFHDLRLGDSTAYLHLVPRSGALSVKLLSRLVVASSLVVAAVIPAAAQDLTGAGATFPYPIYSKWFSDYAARTGVKINYQSIGSGGGIRQLSEQTVDFGASDAPMSDAELAKAKGGAIMHIPTVLGAVVVTYNVPNAPPALRLSGPVVADIFRGKITKWNDARIAALNPGAKLPDV